MMLSKKELEVMNILWGSKYSLTATDIVDASSLTERSWKEKSIYIILRALVDKNVIALDKLKATATNNAKAYLPSITREDYVVMHAKSLNGLDISTLVSALNAESKDG